MMDNHLPSHRTKVYHDGRSCYPCLFNVSIFGLTKEAEELEDFMDFHIIITLQSVVEIQ